MQTPPYRGRFAPSPTGPLHFGSLLAAFGSWLMARHAGGEWLVRIEDLDPLREVTGTADVQLATLARFGMQSDLPVLRQSERGAVYQAALDVLLVRGLAFACHCSRRDLVGEGGVHHACTPGAQRVDPAIRLRVVSACMDFATITAADASIGIATSMTIGFDDAVQGRIAQDVAVDVGDVVLQRADGCWAYQLAVVVDDAAQGITDVVRGADLLDSTPRQILLQRALGLPTPRYAHLPLIVDDDGHKLSKSLASLPVHSDDPLPALRAAWQALGQSAASLANFGHADRLLSHAAREFDPARIPRLRQLPVAALHNGIVAGAA